ncbi:hypothetical protein Tco_1304004 [Tanacetum coccineum]
MSRYCCEAAGLEDWLQGVGLLGFVVKPRMDPVLFTLDTEVEAKFLETRMKQMWVRVSLVEQWIMTDCFNAGGLADWTCGVASLCWWEKI